MSYFHPVLAPFPPIPLHRWPWSAQKRQSDERGKRRRHELWGLPFTTETRHFNRVPLTYSYSRGKSKRIGNSECLHIFSKYSHQSRQFHLPAVPAVNLTLFGLGEAGKAEMEIDRMEWGGSVGRHTPPFILLCQLQCLVDLSQLMYLIQCREREHDKASADYPREVTSSTKQTESCQFCLCKSARWRHQKLSLLPN